MSGWRLAVIGGMAVAVGAAGAACGGNPPPEEPAPRTTDVDEDSLAAARARQDSLERARQREREAADLCERAEAALEAGNYDTARDLFRRAVEEYGGTGCAERADEGLDRVAAVETVKERVHFEFDRSRITDEAARVLQRKAEVLREHPDLRVTVEGHCDERGSLEYNQALGMRRAQATVEYLVGLGLSRDRFRTVSYGEERPLVNASHEQAWARNRRGEFVLQNPAVLLNER